MTRSASILAFTFLAACASAPTRDLLAGAPPEATRLAIGADDATSRAAGSEVSAFSVASLEAGREEPMLAIDPRLFLSPAEESLHNSRFTIKAGYYSAEDADELDGGYIGNLSWMRFLNKLLALEFELGYLAADGEDGGVDLDVWGVPAMVNGRVNVPIWILDVYGGLGLGGIYYDAEVGSQSDDGWLWGGNVFLGGSINLADAIALGLEAKYYVTEEIDDADAALDAYALMLTLGFSR